MEYDEKLIEDAVLALLATFSFDNGNAWKGFDFQIMNRLHDQGFISNPVGKAKSIWLTEEGLERGQAIADRMFGVKGQMAQDQDQAAIHISTDVYQGLVAELERSKLETIANQRLNDFDESQAVTLEEARKRYTGKD